jgi:hypothetical protein
MIAFDTSFSLTDLTKKKGLTKTIEIVRVGDHKEVYGKG